MIRKVVFWTHLSAALAAGAVILMMSATGVVLTYQTQWIRWAENGLAVPARDGESLDLEELRTRAEEAGRAHFESFVPATLILRPGAGMPVQVGGGQSERVYLDPYDGRLLGTGFPRLEAFLETMLGWHRWFNLEGGGRRQGRAWTGAANLVFLLLLCSGLFLWIPRTRTRTHFKQVLFFRRGLRPRAREFNWHSVLGIWSAGPLLVIAASAAVVSYGWAGDIVSWAAGDDPGAPAVPVESTGATRDASAVLSAQGPSLRTALLEAANGPGGAERPWREIHVTLPSARDSTLSARVFRGSRGQPQFEEALRLDRRTGRVLERVRFENQPRARRYRSALRYAHTGEYWGLLGQTIAGLVSLSAVLLGITGVSMATRRLAGFLRRRNT